MAELRHFFIDVRFQSGDVCRLIAQVRTDGQQALFQHSTPPRLADQGTGGLGQLGGIGNHPFFQTGSPVFLFKAVKKVGTPGPW